MSSIDPAKVLRLYEFAERMYNVIDEFLGNVDDEDASALLDEYEEFRRSADGDEGQASAVQKLQVSQSDGDEHEDNQVPLDPAFFDSM